MVLRKRDILKDNSVSSFHSDFNFFETKMRATLGIQTDTVKWLDIREVLFCHVQHGISLPRGLQTDDVELIDRYGGWLWGVQFKDAIYNRLAIGRFLFELSNMMHQSLNGETSYKMMIFSGHDSTLVPVLSAMGIYDNAWPPYASFLTIDIAEDDSTKERFVRVAFNDQDVKLPFATSVWCSFNLFTMKLKDLLVSHVEYKTECESCNSTSELSD